MQTQTAVKPLSTDQGVEFKLIESQRLFALAQKEAETPEEVSRLETLYELIFNCID
jgi:hypothetical protein